jgi:hypothetical protein
MPHTLIGPVGKKVSVEIVKTVDTTSFSKRAAQHILVRPESHAIILLLRGYLTSLSPAKCYLMDNSQVSTLYSHRIMNNFYPRF